jgi:VanZ family protein
MLTQRGMSSSFKYGLLAAAWAALIFWLSTAPGEQLPRVDWLMTPDKFGHFGVYAVLTALVGLSVLYHSLPCRHWRKWVAGSTILYGILLEVLQYSYFPGRYFEFWDIVANISGVFAGLFFLQKFIIHS